MAVRPLEVSCQSLTSATTATVGSITMTLEITRVLEKSVLRVSGRDVWTFSQRKFSHPLTRNLQSPADCAIVNFTETTVILNT